MKKSCVSWRCPACALVLAAMAIDLAAAPASRLSKMRGGAAPAAKSSGGSGGDVRLRKITGGGRQAMIRTPRFKTSVPETSKRPAEWARISVVYDTAPDWVDELTFRYYVLCSKTEKGKTRYSFYRETIRYGDIEKGREHVSALFIHPSAVKRYGPPVAAAVEISLDGQVVAVDSDVDQGMSSRLPPDWWTNSTVLESKEVTARDGYLLTRQNTPFASINVDDYEAIK